MNAQIQIACHGAGPFVLGPVHWRARGERDAGQTCSYCGSLHPGDLQAALAAGAKMTGSDWKYGWPHKFYVSGVPSAEPGVTTHAKFYSVHLKDLDAQDFAELAHVLKPYTGIEFSIQEGTLMYRAPHHGYQR